MATIYIKNLTSSNLSLMGNIKTNQVSVGSAVGSYATILDSELLGDDVLCTSLASLITAGSIQASLNSLTGTVITATNILKYAAGTSWDNDGDGVLEREDLNNKRLKVAGLAVDTLNDEVSAALGGNSTDLFVPTKILVHLEDVGAGAAAAGDYQITIGTAAGGTQLLSATACTACKDLNDTFQIAVAGLKDAISADATIYVKCTSADSTAGAGHLADTYILGEYIVKGA